MFRKEVPGAPLSPNQESELVHIILDLRGRNLSHAEFSETLFQLLEDVSGFENSKPDALKNLSWRLWRRYGEIDSDHNESGMR